MNESRFLVVGELMDVWTFVGLYDDYLDAWAKKEMLMKQTMWKNVRVLEVAEKTE